MVAWCSSMRRPACRMWCADACVPSRMGVARTCLGGVVPSSEEVAVGAAVLRQRSRLVGGHLPR